MTPDMSPEGRELPLSRRETQGRTSTAHRLSHSCPLEISDERSLGLGRSGK